MVIYFCFLFWDGSDDATRQAAADLQRLPTRGPTLQPIPSASLAQLGTHLVSRADVRLPIDADTSQMGTISNHPAGRCRLHFDEIATINIDLTAKLPEPSVLTGGIRSVMV